MEKVIHAEFDPETYDTELTYWLCQFCEENKIDDLRAASQSVWNAALRYIYKHVFRGTDKLKTKTLGYNINNNIITNNNAYDHSIVNYILDIYLDLCMLYDKEISIMGFCNLTGIEYNTLEAWGHNNNKLSTTGFPIYQKIIQNREESLSNKLATGNKNPVGILAILNRYYQWNLPGVSKEPAKPAALSASELPRLGNGIVQSAQNALPDDLETVE